MISLYLFNNINWTVIYKIVYQQLFYTVIYKINYLELGARGNYSRQQWK